MNFRAPTLAIARGRPVALAQPALARPNVEVGDWPKPASAIFGHAESILAVDSFGRCR